MVVSELNKHAYAKYAWKYYDRKTSLKFQHMF